MGFENLKASTPAKEAALAAAAIAGMELPDQALAMPVSAPTHIEQSYDQIDTEALHESINAGLDELQDDRENGYGPDKGYENIAPPPSIVETLEQNGNKKALRTYQAGMKQLQAYATEKKEEDMAFFSLSPDGVGKWVKPDVLFRADNSKDESAVVKYGTVVVDTRKLIKMVDQKSYVVDIHTHPTQITGYDERTKEAFPQTRHAPPSPPDVFKTLSILRHSNFENIARLESVTVTEMGSWRYGFVSAEAAKNLDRSLKGPILEIIPLLKLPSHQLQIEMLGAHFLELTTRKDIVGEQKEYFKFMGDLLSEPDTFIAYLESSPASLEYTTNFFDMTLTDSDTGLEGLDGLMGTLKAARDKQRSELERIDGEYAGELIGAPNLGKETADADYLSKWKRLGVYMESQQD